MYAADMEHNKGGGVGGLAVYHDGDPIVVWCEGPVVSS